MRPTVGIFVEDDTAGKFGQPSVVVFQAFQEKQERIVPAPFEFVANLADLLQVAVRVGDKNPCAFFMSQELTPDDNDADSLSAVPCNTARLRSSRSLS